MRESFSRLYTLLNVHVESTVQKIGEVVQFSNARTALSDTTRSVMNSCFDVSTDLLLLLDLAYRELPRR